MARGGYRPGSGRPLGAPNRVKKEIQAVLADLDPPAVDRLQALIHSTDEAIAIRAIELILSYLHGKPPRSVQVETYNAFQVLEPELVDGLPPALLRKLLLRQTILPEDLADCPLELVKQLAIQEDGNDNQVGEPDSREDG